MKRNIYILLTGVSIGVIPYMYLIADLERGYNSTGGEMFFLALPIVFGYMAIKERKIIKKNLQKGIDK